MRCNREMPVRSATLSAPATWREAQRDEIWPATPCQQLTRDIRPRGDQDEDRRNGGSFAALIGAAIRAGNEETRAAREFTRGNLRYGYRKTAGAVRAAR